MVDEKLQLAAAMSILGTCLSQARVFFVYYFVRPSQHVIRLLYFLQLRIVHAHRRRPCAGV